MAKALFDAEPVFREALSLCTTLLKPHLGLDLLEVIHAPDRLREAMTARLKDTALAQPAIFSVGYALAKQWDHWGIRPDVMVGHSIGELAAATIAGVIALPDALELIALRGRLMADLPGGVMISVRASEAELAPFMGLGLDLAAVNGAKACVLAGPETAAAALVPKLEAAGFVTSRLHTSHAFHSQMMEAAVAPFRAAVAKLTLRPPQVPILSTVTGDWLTDAEATDPDYWASHMRRPVRFYDAIQILWAEGRHIFLETGPGRTMATLAGQNPDRKRVQPALASLPHAQAEDADSYRGMLETFGLLWANGCPVDWSRLDGARPKAARATGLPTYPFQRKRFWVEPVDAAPAALQALDAPSGDPEVTADAGPALSVAEALRDMLSDLSGVDPADMDGGASFLELGFDSLLLTQATRELAERFGVTVTLRQLIDGLPTIDALSAHIEANGTLRGQVPSDRTPVAELTRIEIAPEPAAEATPSSAPMTKISREVEELTADQRAHIDALVARYTTKTAKSKALTAKYRPVHADPRTASGFNRLWKELVYQIVTVRSKGSRLIDVDGNEYIDILNGFGPGFLGHSPEAVVSALHGQLDQGFEVGPQSLAAMEAAQLFCEVTGNDRASFVCTGSEAVYAAMRLARTCTGRDRIVMFARDYHGNFDEVLVRGLDGKDGPRTLPLAPGIPRDAVKNVIVLPYGSPQALDYIRKNADSLAAVIVEPVQSRRPEFRPAEFIREVRRVTEKSGTLFIFDEVVTGFRFGPRGAQGYYNVSADLVTYGKVVGGGMPVGVVSGKARYMDTFDGGQWQFGDDSFPEAPVTFFAGTFVRHPLAMAALRAMLTHFKAQPDFFWKTVNAKGDRLAGTVDRWFADNDMPFQMPNCGSLMYLRIGEDQKYGALLGAHLRDRGVFMLEGFPSYMTAAHDDEDIDYLIDAFKDSAQELRAAGLLTGREPVAYKGPRLSAVPPRLALPGGAEKIAAAMAAPLGTLSVPTTEAQREIWAAMIVTPEVTPAYNESVSLKIRGLVDRPALIEATRACVRRHDALRSTFSDDGDQMRVLPDLAIEVPFVDLSKLTPELQAARLAEILDREVELPFDMRDGPFVRACLVAFGEDHHHLIITAHHIVCDGWSIDVVMRDIGTIYTALHEDRRPELPVPLSIIDYAHAEADWSRTEEAAAARDYWLGQFKGKLPLLDLPTDHPRPARRSIRGARV
ncbi:MAG: aminotransferase class III-fold pyridoxal phosphate-dependent enzyme, partial [Tabrizicola sp.]|nr:aminotransferase class III-fold pyridoxal phosphate-dependent enzyme [Tabrizicola sp.]